MKKYLLFIFIISVFIASCGTDEEKTRSLALSVSDCEQLFTNAAEFYQSYYDFNVSESSDINVSIQDRHLLECRRLCDQNGSTCDSFVQELDFYVKQWESSIKNDPLSDAISLSQFETFCNRIGLCDCPGVLQSGTTHILKDTGIECWDPSQKIDLAETYRNLHELKLLFHGDGGFLNPDLNVLFSSNKDTICNYVRAGNSCDAFGLSVDTDLFDPKVSCKMLMGEDCGSSKMDVGYTGVRNTCLLAQQSDALQSYVISFICD